MTNANFVSMATLKPDQLVNHVRVHVSHLKTGLTCSLVPVIHDLDFMHLVQQFHVSFPYVIFSGEPEATCSMDKEGEPVCDRCPEGHEGNLCDR